MGGLFSKPKMPEQKPPDPPIAIPETGEADATQKHKITKAGRGGTVLAGQMAPSRIFKKKVLGGGIDVLRV